MSPISKCLICRRDIERSTKTFWIKKGHLLCSSCLDSIDKNLLKKYWKADFLKSLKIYAKKNPDKSGSAFSQIVISQD